MFDRPNALELLQAAIEELSSQDAAPTLNRSRFQYRVAVRALTIVERELRLGPTQDKVIHAVLTALLMDDCADGGHRNTDGSSLLKELSQRIRAGTAPNGAALAVREMVQRKLAIARPEILDEYSDSNKQGESIDSED